MGAIVKDIETGDAERIVKFSGHYTVTVVPRNYRTFRTYNALNGVLLYEGEILPQSYHWLDVDREDGESFRFATVGSDDEKAVIDINQFQPSSTPPCRTVESFIVPHHRYGLEVPFAREGDDWEVSFSLASFHASFTTWEEITVFDIRDSKILLRTERPQDDECLDSGDFSPDGAFFAVRIDMEIHVWQNTSAGYTPWSCLESRSPFDQFSFSPTGISILVWGAYGVQLLDNHTHIPSPNKKASSHNGEDHRVAYSKDGTWIATARQDGNVVTVLDALSGTPQRSITTARPILDIGIVGNTVIMANMRGLVRWDLEVGEIMHSAFGALAAEIAVMDDTARHFTLSTDCSWIAFSVERTIFLYDILDQRVVYKHVMDYYVADIWWAPHGRQLCFAPGHNRREDLRVRGVMLSETVEQWRIVDVTKEITEGVRSRDDLFPLHGSCIQLGSEWIEDSGGKKLLWLSPNWRVLYCSEARFDGNFLALIDEHHPVPIIIVSQPQLLPPSIPSNRRIFSTSPQS